MLWEVEIRPAAGQVDREGARVLAECQAAGAKTIHEVAAGRSFLIEGELQRSQVELIARELLVDSLVERFELHLLTKRTHAADNGRLLLNVLFKPGVTDNVGATSLAAVRARGTEVDAVATCRKYWLNADAGESEVDRIAGRILANDAIERIIRGPLRMESIAVGSPYQFQLKTVAIRAMSDDELADLSRTGQLYLSLVEMQTIRQHFIEQDRDPTDVELETIAQTWSEHCSHKTLAGRIHYREIDTPPLAKGGPGGVAPVEPNAQTPPQSPPWQGGQVTSQRHFENMLKETIFAATETIREQLGDDDWCVSVFKDNAGIVTFDDEQNVCFKVETHNHPSALEPYGGANTGIGGVIRDPLGTGLGARPVCNTDVFCFAPPDTPHNSLPPGVLHPKAVAQGVVAGVRDYGNRMGIPTVNGAVFFDERYLGNPLVYCGNVAMIPVDKCEKRMRPGDFIVAVGGRTGRDGIHGATFSSAELTEESEDLSGGAVQIGNAITEKMVADVILEARDRDLYSSITDCGAGGFSSAVGEMGEETGAEVWLEKAPLKYAGLSYTEIWISEAQERMVLAVPPDNWTAFHKLCESEGVEATIIGKFTATKRLVLKYDDHLVGDLSMSFLHDGRPPVVRDATYQASIGREPYDGSCTSAFRTYLEAKGKRLTNEKTIIVNEVFQQTEPFDGEKLYERLANSERRVSRPTVFRALGDLADAGLIRIVGSENGLDVYETIGDASANPQSAIHNPQSPAPVADATGSPSYDEALTSILGSLNVCSKEWIIRQYDHEVQAGSVVKPLVGAANDGPSDAAVVRPVLTSNRGLAVSNGMNPRYGDIDPYWMAASAIDEAVRNCVAVGADPQRIAILDNFCWGNTEKPEVLGSLVRAAIGCHDTAIAFGTPFISGKDSLNNEFSYYETANKPGAQATGERRTVAIPPSLLISALGQLDDVNRAVTMDLKEAGNLLYQIGETKTELGGSHYALTSPKRKRGEADAVPKVDLERAPRIFAALHKAITAGLIRSCHDLSEGGLAVALAEMAFAGELGVDADLGAIADVSGLPVEVLLFSESNTRFVVEIDPANQAAFEKAFDELPLFPLGTVTAGNRVTVRHADDVALDSAWADLKAAWQAPLAWS